MMGLKVNQRLIFFSMVFLASMFFFFGHWYAEEKNFMGPRIMAGSMDEGWKKYYEGKESEALLFWEGSLKKNQKNPNAHAGVGWVFLKRGEKERAKNEFLAALRLDEGNYNANSGLAHLLYFERDYKKASAHLNVAFLSKYKRSIDYQLSGRLLLKEKEYSEAKKMFEKALIFGDEESLSRIGLFLSDYGSGDIREANDQLSRLWPYVFDQRSKPDAMFMDFLSCAIPNQNDAAHVFRCGEKL